MIIKLFCSAVALRCEPYSIGHGVALRQKHKSYIEHICGPHHLDIIIPSKSTDNCDADEAKL